MTDEKRRASSFPEKVAAATGLAGMLADGALKRCCERANVEFERMTPRDLRRLLPQLELILVIYLPPDKLQASMERLRRLADAAPPARRS